MLLNVAAEYTVYNLRDTAQFFISSEWNLRNLSRSVGDGGPVTMFASTNSGYNFFNLEDTTRLATDKWKPHMWDLLRHMMVQGVYLEQDLKDLYVGNGNQEYNLTSLAGQPITIGYDSGRNVVQVDGGDLFYADIKGVDG